MKKYVLVGENINYTLSPKLHKMFFQEMDIDGEYGIEDGYRQKNKEKFLKNIVDKVKTGELKGVNITVPYKEEILKYLDILDFEAEKIGSVNTIVLEDGKVKGYNTDYIGVLETFNKMKINLKNKKIYILGNGGSAKAVFRAMEIKGGAPCIVSRNKNELYLEEKKIISYEEMEKLISNEREESFIVNTTPVGNLNSIDLSPIRKEIVEKVQGVLDLHYSPLKTKLMKYSLRSENGLYMLVVQGIESEKIWNKNLDFSNKRDIIEKIYEYLKKELEKNG